jgi:hypothetical protein
VKIDTAQLKKQYSSMTDEALLDMDPEELTDEARACLDAELNGRGFAAEDAVPTPDWIDDGFSVCSYTAHPGGTAASDAAAACDALHAAGIPCHIASEEVGDPPRRELRIMVPGGRTLEATSVLDQKIFNVEIEADWESHLEGLSDEDFRAIDPEMICAGLLDRAHRLKQAYDNELARRIPHDDDE